MPDLRGGAPGTCAPGSKFFHFDAIIALFGVGASLGKILDPPLLLTDFFFITMVISGHGATACFTISNLLSLLVVQHVISWHKSIRLSLLILCFINKLSRILFCFYWVGRGSFNLTLSSFLSNLNVAIRRLQVEPPWPSV